MNTFIFDVLLALVGAAIFTFFSGRSKTSTGAQKGNALQTPKHPHPQRKRTSVRKQVVSGSIFVRQKKK